LNRLKSEIEEKIDKFNEQMIETPEPIEKELSQVKEDIVAKDF